MCVRLISAAWPVKMASSTKLLLIVLADRANPAKENACWPSIAYIVRHTGLSERTVQTHLQLLERTGHITMLPRKGTSTKYFVHPREDCTPEENAPVQPTPKGGANKAENPRSPRTQNVSNNNLKPYQPIQKWALPQMPIPPIYALNVPKSSNTEESRPVTILSADFMKKGLA